MNNGFFDDVEVDVNGPIFATVGPTWLAHRFTAAGFVGKTVITDNFHPPI